MCYEKGNGSMKILLKIMYTFEYLTLSLAPTKCNFIINSFQKGLVRMREK